MALSSNVLPNSALFVRKQWCDQILNGSKLWELRGQPTSKRGRICLAESKSNLLVGEVDIVDCLLVGARDKENEIRPASGNNIEQDNFLMLPNNMSKHGVDDMSVIKYKTIYAWVLERPSRYQPPLLWRPPQGAVQFVRLDGRMLINRQPFFISVVRKRSGVLPTIYEDQAEWTRANKGLKQAT